MAKQPKTKPAATKDKSSDGPVIKKDDKAVAELLSRLTKTFGAGVIMVGDAQVPNVEFISTGIAALDANMGGGVPRGRILEIFGVESCGKTTTVLEFIASCQRTYFEKTCRYGRCAFIDAEHSLDPTWARNVGVNTDDLLLNQPNNGEEAFEVTEQLVKSGLVDLVVIDSVAGLRPQEELDGEITDVKMAPQARLMSKGLRRLAPTVHKSSASVIFINQLRQKVGVIFGNPETTPGGLALKYYASIRIDLRRGKNINAPKPGAKSGDDSEAKGEALGMGVKANVVKNKVAPPFRKCEYSIYFGHPPSPDAEQIYGVDKIGSLFDAALYYGIIEGKGSSYSFADTSERLGQGRDKSILALHGDLKHMVEDLRKKVVVAAAPKGKNLIQASDDELNESLNGDGVEEIPVGEDNEEEDLTTARE